MLPGSFDNMSIVISPFRQSGRRPKKTGELKKGETLACYLTSAPAPEEVKASNTEAPSAICLTSKRKPESKKSMMYETTNKHPKLTKPTLHHGQGFSLLLENVPTKKVVTNTAKPSITTKKTRCLLQGPWYLENVFNTKAIKITLLAISARRYELKIAMIINAAESVQVQDASFMRASHASVSFHYLNSPVFFWRRPNWKRGANFPFPGVRRSIASSSSLPPAAAPPAALCARSGELAAHLSCRGMNALCQNAGPCQPV
jgi:hypothetical protein